MTITEPALQPPTTVAEAKTPTPMDDLGFRPEQLTAETIADMPEFNPPSHDATVSDSAGATRWVTTKVKGLWSHEADRNAFALLEGETAWRRIDPTPAGCFEDLNTLLSTAFAAVASTRVQLTDNVITAVYVF